MATVGGPGSPGSVSRTARYRKVTKPLLERRRRARINRCLDELKDLMVGALEVERENISKLEKADILELTVRHLSKQRAPRDPRAEAERFQAGFGHCASEAYHFILSSPGVDSAITRQLVRHLSSQMHDGPVGLPALPSPVPSDSSLSPGAGSKDYSPNYYADRPRARSVASPTEECDRTHPGWKGDTRSVPVEQSLTCDVAPYNSRPVSAAGAEGMPGLLMTVNNECAPRQFPATSNLNSHFERHRPPEVKERYDIRNAHNSESKNLIMQKIREHILERQHREPESMDLHQKRARHPGNLNNSYKDDSVQFALSKNVNNPSYSMEPNARTLRRVPSPGVSEEAINLTSAPVAMEKVEPQKYDGNFKTAKQRADYKSIHPKKVMIRTPKNHAERDEGGVSLERQNLDKPAISLDHPRGRDDTDNCSEGDDSTASFDDRDISAAEAYYLRYKYREYHRQQQQCQDQVDDENMWRPW